MTLPKPGLVSLFYRPISGTFLDYIITMQYSAIPIHRLAGNVLGKVSTQTIDKNIVDKRHLDIVALAEIWLTHDDETEMKSVGGGRLEISRVRTMTDTFESFSFILQCPKTRCNVRIYVIYRPLSSPLSARSWKASVLR